MSSNFIRAYELTIIGEDGRVRIIRDLRVLFEITKSILSFPNRMKLTLINAAPDTIAALQSKFTKVTLNAGYRGNIKLLFTGQIRNVFQERNPTDTRTIVYAGDGQRDWENATFDRTFTDTVSIIAAIREVVAAFQDISIGTLEGVPEVANMVRGQTLSGSPFGILDDYASEYGFTWSVQDGEVVIVQDDEPLQGSVAVVVTAATGMVDSPTTTVIGANVVTQLNPSLVPNRAFRIKSVNAGIQWGNLFFKQIPRTNPEGLYKIQEVIFRGDSFYGEWTSSLVGKTINVR